MTSKRPVLAELAPSQERQDEPTVSRVGGMLGWCAVLVGAVVALVNIYSETPRLLPEWVGWFVLLLGLFGVFLHASVETDRLLRQLIGGAAPWPWPSGSGWPVGSTTRIGRSVCCR